MPSVRKKELLADLSGILKEKNNFILTRYSGLDVEQITGLRRVIRNNDGKMKVIKNNIFRLALKEAGDYEDVLPELDKIMEGPLAAVFSNGNFPALSKELVKSAKDLEPVEILAGCMDGKFLSKGQVMEIATLPSHEELLAIIGRGLKAPATKIAMGMNQIIASLARGINEVAKKSGG